MAPTGESRHLPHIILKVCPTSNPRQNTVITMHDHLTNDTKDPKGSESFSILPVALKEKPVFKLLNPIGNFLTVSNKGQAKYQLELLFVENFLLKYIYG